MAPSPPQRLLLLGAIALAALAAGPAVAGASTSYWLEACGPSGGNVFTFSGDGDLTGSNAGCGAQTSAGFSVEDSRNVPQEPSGAIGGWVLTAPAGESIEAVEYSGGGFSSPGGGWIAGWEGNNPSHTSLTTALDPGESGDCDSTPTDACSKTNPASFTTIAFGPGVGPGPLTQLALAVGCQSQTPCQTGSATASVGTAEVELLDPDDEPEAATSLSPTTGGYYSSQTPLTMTYSVDDPAGVCAIQARLVVAGGPSLASTTQGTTTPARDPNTNAFTSTLPCGSANTDAHTATRYTFAPPLAGLGAGTYDLQIVAANPAQASSSGAGESVVWQQAIAVDNSVPTVSITTTAQPGTWYSTPQNLTINASDATGSSGIFAVTCTGPGTPGANAPILAARLPLTVTVPGPGAQTVSCQAVSTAGISSATQSATVDVDTQAPTTTFAGAAPTPTVLPGPQAVAVAATEPQAASGIRSISCIVTEAGGAPHDYTISGSSGQLAANDFGAGENVVSCQSTTNAGVTGLPATETIDVVDDHQPVVSFGGARPAPKWLAGRQQVTATAAEPRSSTAGVGSVKCSINGGPAKSATGDSKTLELSRTGTYKIACAATSLAGVRGPTATETIQLDNSIPTGAWPGSRRDSRKASIRWLRSPRRVGLTFTSRGGAPMRQVRCRLPARQIVFKPTSAGVRMGGGGMTETVAVQMSSPGGTLVCQGQSAAGRWSKPLSRTLEIDPAAPTGHFDPMSPHDRVHVHALLKDSGSGVAGAAIELEMPSGWMKLSTSFDRSTGLATATVPDDGSIPDGLYTLRVVARDHAGNRAIIYRDRAGKLETVTLPLRELTRLSAVLAAGSNRATSGSHLRLSYGKPAQLSGQLMTDRGRPIRFASVLLEQQVAGSAPRPVTTLRTDNDGRFSDVVRGGPTRTLKLVYLGNRMLRPTSAAAGLRVHGRATVSVGNPRAGADLTIGGHVSGGWIPPGGVVVQLWYEIKGDSRGWAPFEHAIHTDQSGAFDLTFPVSSRAGGYTYRFKAVIPRQGAWPFLGTTSKVLVRTVSTL